MKWKKRRLGIAANMNCARVVEVHFFPKKAAGCVPIATIQNAPETITRKGVRAFKSG